MSKYRINKSSEGCFEVQERAALFFWLPTRECIKVNGVYREQFVIKATFEEARDWILVQRSIDDERKEAKKKPKSQRIFYV